MMYLRSKILLLFSLSILSFHAFAQIDEEYPGWWNDKHLWEEGFPHWSQYIITNPAQMGPNALPIPDVYKARLDSVVQYELRFDQFSHPEDNTFDFAAVLYWPIANGKAALKVTALQEWYDMSHDLRDERRARDWDPKGNTSGDVLFEFKYQLLLDHEKYPDLSFHAGLRTASGGDFHNARFSDAPGYNFALSFGENYQHPERFIEKVEWNLMLGLYVWQTYVSDNRQNDAPLYGFSILTSHKKWTWDNSISGYYGYLDQGEYPIIYGDIPKSDHPLIYKTQLSYLQKKWIYKIAFKKGFYSFKYDVYQMSIGYRIKPKG